MEGINSRSTLSTVHWKRSPYQFLCLQVSLVLANYHAPCYEQASMGVCLYPHLFVCVLALLCSWANKAPFCPGHWYEPIKGCDHPERFNDGWDARVDHITERGRKRDGMLWGGPVLRLSGSPANSRQDKINLALLLSEEMERQGSCTVGSIYRKALWAQLCCLQWLALWYGYDSVSYNFTGSNINWANCSQDNYNVSRSYLTIFTSWPFLYACHITTNGRKGSDFKQRTHYHTGGMIVLMFFALSAVAEIETTRTFVKHQKLSQGWKREENTEEKMPCQPSADRSSRVWIHCN